MIKTQITVTPNGQILLTYNEIDITFETLDDLFDFLTDVQEYIIFSNMGVNVTPSEVWRVYSDAHRN